MKILLLGGKGGGHSRKGASMRKEGHEVTEPKMPYYLRSWEAWMPSRIWSNWLGRSLSHGIQRARVAERSFRPDLIVGDSTGGAVALAMQCSTPMVLLAPAVRVMVRGPIRFWLSDPKLRRILGVFPRVIAGSFPGGTCEFGRITHLPAVSLILHSPADDWVPFDSSLELLRRHPVAGDESVARLVGRIEEWARPRGGDPRAGAGRLIATGSGHLLDDFRSKQLLVDGVSHFAQLLQLDR